MHIGDQPELGQWPFESKNVCHLDALFGGSSQTTKSSPWGPQTPYLKDVFAQAQNLYDSGPPSYYPQSTVASQTPAQTAALSGIESTAANNPATAAATGYFSDLMGGKYLNSNPYQDQTAQSVLSKVIPAVSSQFVQGNNMGSSAAPYAVSQGATAALAPIEYQNYQDQLANMTKGLALAPQTQQMPYNDLSQMLHAGTLQQGQNQAQLSDLVNRWNFNQQAPYTALQNYQNMVSGNYGGTQTTQQNTNPLSSIMGFMSQPSNSFGSTFSNIGSNLGSMASGIGSLLAFL